MELFNLAKQLIENDIDCHISYSSIGEGKGKKYFINVGTSLNYYIQEPITNVEFEELHILLIDRYKKSEEKKKEHILQILNKKLGN